MALMSQRAYARHRAERGLPGGTHRAVQKAIERGRIRVTADGLIDADEADRLWAANSSEGHRRNDAQAKAPESQPPARHERPAVRRRGGDEAATPRSAEMPPEPLDALDRPLSFAEANALEKTWKARLAELDYRERAGELVNAAEMRAQLVDVFTRCRTKLLGIPSRARQQLPHLSKSDIDLLDSLIREALEELADDPLDNSEPEEGDGDV